MCAQEMERKFECAKKKEENKGERFREDKEKEKNRVIRQK